MKTVFFYTNNYHNKSLSRFLFHHNYAALANIRNNSICFIKHEQLLYKSLLDHIFQTIDIFVRTSFDRVLILATKSKKKMFRLYFFSEMI